MNHIFMGAIVVFMLWSGWYPIGENNVDLPSMFCFVVACFNAYMWGLTSK